jgi:hypothetical protein
MRTNELPLAHYPPMLAPKDVADILNVSYPCARNLMMSMPHENLGSGKNRYMRVKKSYLIQRYWSEEYANAEDEEDEPGEPGEIVIPERRKPGRPRKQPA